MRRLVVPREVLGGIPKRGSCPVIFRVVTVGFGSASDRWDSSATVRDGLKAWSRRRDEVPEAAGDDKVDGAMAWLPERDGSPSPAIRITSLRSSRGRETPGPRDRTPSGPSGPMAAQHPVDFTMVINRTQRDVIVPTRGCNNIVKSKCGGSDLHRSIGQPAA